MCFLQETHIKTSAAKVLRLRWASQIFQSNCTVKARGVAILIHKKDKGRYLVVRGLLNEIPVTLINVYGPNLDDPGFFLALFRVIPNLSQ